METGAIANHERLARSLLIMQEHTPTLIIILMDFSGLPFELILMEGLTLSLLEVMVLDFIQLVLALPRTLFTHITILDIFIIKGT